MATAAEAELDDRARKIMKANPGIGYPKACSQALLKDPSLYNRYQAELANGGAALQRARASRLLRSDDRLAEFPWRWAVIPSNAGPGGDARLPSPKGRCPRFDFA